MFRLAIAGELPGEPHIFRQIDEQIGQLKGYLYTHGGGDDITILASPSYTGGAWWERMRIAGFPMCGYCMCPDADKLGDCVQVVREDTPLRSVIGEAVCDSADLIFMIWDEDVTQFQGASWELMQLAHLRKVPCMWISSRTMRLYWARESYYEPYVPRQLNLLCEVCGQAGIEPGTSPDRRIPLLGMGRALYQKYLSRYDALSKQNEAEKDRLLRDDFSMGEHMAGEKLRRVILEEFHRFDEAAIELNSRYLAVIYWQAVLPFVTTVFLAAGSYVEVLLGPLPIPRFLLAVAAGISFLIYGLLNLYVYYLSRSGAIKQCQSRFVENRYMAEVLRVLVHFIPYGVSMNLRKLCGGNQRAYVTVRRIMEREKPALQEVNKRSVFSMLSHVEEMLEDQLSYHGKSAGRYERILGKLDKWYFWTFGAGFGAVALCSLLQFVLSLFPIAGSLNGVGWNDFVKGFANMLALLLPAWALYFSSKAAQCNFRYNAENHRRMAGRLSEMRDRIRALRQGGDVPMEALNILLEELAETMLLEDAYAWRHQYMGL